MCLKICITLNSFQEKSSLLTKLIMTSYAFSDMVSNNYADSSFLVRISSKCQPVFKKNRTQFYLI